MAYKHLTTFGYGLEDGYYFLTTLGFGEGVELYGDCLRWYLTGAASDGGAQSDPDLSLGNYRSSTEVERVGVLEANAIYNIKVVLASRENGTDGAIANIFANGDDTLQYFASGSDADNSSVDIINGETRVIFDDDAPNKWARVNRDTTDTLAGGATLEFTDIWNNVIGMLDAAEAESAAGGSRYRAIAVKNDELTDVTGISVYIATLAGPSVSSVAQLSGAGAGSITGATNAFCGWPQRGWARIETSGGTLREIVYYSSRTDITLTVPALGRSRLGTSAGAGAATDNIYSVPGIRIGIEAPIANAIQTIASESTAPTGITWSTARTAVTGPSIGTLAAGDWYGVWIHRELPAGVTANAKHLNHFKAGYTLDSVTYTESLTGMFRIADDDVARYELFVGTDSAPDTTGTPTETFTSLPYTTTMTFAASHTYYLVTQRRNKFNLVTDYRKFTILTINAGGAEQVNPPSNPEVITWEAAEGGAFKLEAVYFYNSDTVAQRADAWLLYITTNGIDPVPGVDVPVEIAMTFADVAEYLTYTTSTFAGGTTGKIIVRVRRNGTPDVDSDSLTVHSATADATGPTAVSGGAFYQKSGKVQQ
jgi:hypothetical protein